MGLPIILLGVLLLQSAFAIRDEDFESSNPFNPEDDTDVDNFMDIKARNDKFLRIGKQFWGGYEKGNRIPYNGKESQRTVRNETPEKNGNFERFGRSRDDLLRLDDSPQQRTIRGNQDFLRFGRSIAEENKKKRGKRGVVPIELPEAMKRPASYLRLRRNSHTNFMRFGRNPEHLQIPSYMEEALLKHIFDSRNDHLTNFLNDLLKQSKDNLGHNNEI